MPYRPIITLTTDFGTNDHFVGTMKGVILNIAPEAAIVDISHAVQAFDVHALRWVEVQSLQSGSADVPLGDVSRFVDDDGNLMVRIVGASTASVNLSADPARAS